MGGSADDGDVTMPRALITGITGQDGSYLADLLLAKGYEECDMMAQENRNNNADLL